MRVPPRSSRRPQVADAGGASSRLCIASDAKRTPISAVFFAVSGGTAGRAAPARDGLQRNTAGHFVTPYVVGRHRRNLLGTRILQTNTCGLDLQRFQQLSTICGGCTICCPLRSCPFPSQVNTTIRPTVRIQIRIATRPRHCRRSWNEADTAPRPRPERHPGISRQ
jgi:hypothetical protein